MNNAALRLIGAETDGDGDELVPSERAWMQELRKLNTRVEDIRTELLTAIERRPQFQSITRAIRDLLAECDQEIGQQALALSARQKEIAELEAKLIDATARADERLAGIRSDIERHTADIAAERDRREQVIAEQAQTIADLRAEIGMLRAELRAEATERQVAIDHRLDAFWTELARRTAADIRAEREQREKVIAEQASLIAAREKEISALETKFVVEKAEASERFAAFRGDIDRQIALS